MSYYQFNVSAIMDIITNYKLFNSKIVSTNFDYVQLHLQEHISYLTENDLLVPLYRIDGMDDYSLMFRYLELIEDSPCVYSWFPKIHELFSMSKSSGRVHSHPKSLLYVNLWKHIGIYISSECRSRFLKTHYSELAFLRSKLQNSSDVAPYKHSFKHLLDYLEFSMTSPIINIYEFDSNESSIFRFTVEDSNIKVPSYILGAKIYSYKRVFLNTVLASNKKVSIPAGVLYKLFM